MHTILFHNGINAVMAYYSRIAEREAIQLITTKVTK